MTDSSADSRDISEASLKGTTFKVYRYILKQNRPVSISDAQRGLGLSSPSVSQYHIRKLLRHGLIREEQGGYVIDKMVLENIVRVRRFSFPIQTGYVARYEPLTLTRVGVGLYSDPWSERSMAASLFDTSNLTESAGSFESSNPERLTSRLSKRKHKESWIKLSGKG
jgi:hypothetical protein